MPKYDDVTVKLTGVDGNVFVLAARVGIAIEAAHGTEAKNEFYHALQRQKSYDDALRFFADTVNVE